VHEDDGREMKYTRETHVKVARPDLFGRGREGGQTHVATARLINAPNTAHLLTNHLFLCLS
jgi:hypothetical protein